MRMLRRSGEVETELEVSRWVTGLLAVLLALWLLGAVLHAVITTVILLEELRGSEPVTCDQLELLDPVLWAAECFTGS